jgi:N-acetylglucosaminyl-diphospho-decaprenol L-rhamnosyltransferase
MSHPIAVVTVTYNSADHVTAMIGSIRDSTQGDVPIIVVDNGSRDGTCSLLRQFSDVVVTEQSNTGYADGVNRGIELAPDGHDVLVINPDVVVETVCIERLVAALAEHSAAAVVVPALVDTTGRLLPSLRHAPSAWRILAEALLGGRRAGRFGEAFRPTPGAGPQEAEWATGAVMLLRRAALTDVGPWDTSFFLYSEETEFCLRARRAGYRVLCEPRATALHVGGAMGIVPGLWALRAVNRVRLQRRRAGVTAGAAFHLASILFELRRAAMGHRVSRVAVRSLLRRDLDREAVRLTCELGGDPTPMLAPTRGSRID